MNSNLPEVTIPRGRLYHHPYFFIGNKDSYDPNYGSPEGKHACKNEDLGYRLFEEIKNGEDGSSTLL